LITVHGLKVADVKETVKLVLELVKVELELVVSLMDFQFAMG